MDTMNFLTLDLIYTMLVVAPFILGLLGVVLFFVGYRWIRWIYLILGITSGFVLGYFVGVVVNSMAIAMTLGLIFSIVFGFFSYFHYFYLKGISLGILGILSTFLLMMNFTSFGHLIVGLGVSIIVGALLAALVYKKEILVTTLVTSLLGALIGVNIIIDMTPSPLAAFVALLLWGAGVWLQLFAPDMVARLIKGRSMNG